MAGYWPHRAAFRRAARWDGVFPGSTVAHETGAPIPLDELRAILAVINEERGEAGMTQLGAGDRRLTVGQTDGSRPARATRPGRSRRAVPVTTGVSTG